MIKLICSGSGRVGSVGLVRPRGCTTGQYFQPFCSTSLGINQARDGLLEAANFVSWSLTQRLIKGCVGCKGW